VIDKIPRKIAFILPSLKFGGAERVVINLAKALTEAGAQVEILLMSEQGEFLGEAQSHFNVINLSCDKTYKLPVKLLLYFIKHRPNVLISSFWKLNLCSCVARMLYPSVKLLLWEHSMPSKSKNSPKWLYAISASVFYRFANKVVTVSSGVFNDVTRWTVGLKDKVVVIFNPINPPKQNLLSFRTQRDIQLLIWVGRLEEPKNPKLMLEAFNLLPLDCKANLLLVGDGGLRQELEERCKELGLQSRVKFWGYHANPYEVMADSDLLVLSSDREGLGNVLVEALFCGLRVVSTNCGEGVKDILHDNYYGTIVPCNDKYALAQAIENELKTPHDPKIQINGAERFLPQVVVKQFLLAMQ
jgi:glycosyltransferase involved in cell wall biosynthesis